MNVKLIDWHMLGAKTIINAFGGYALYLSYGHITDLFETWGARPDQAHAAPAFIDGFMVLGRIMMSKRFCDRTNRIGHWMIIGGAAASLTANVLAAHSLGAGVLGVLVVAGYLVCEAAAGSIRSRAQVIKDEAAAEATAKRSAAAQQGAATRKANNTAKSTPASKTTTKTVAKPRTRKPAAKSTVKAIPTNAPISPAPGGMMVRGLWVARSLDEAIA